MEHIDGLVVVNEHTGELVEGVGAPASRLEWLAMAYQDAALNIAGWEARAAQLKAAIGEELKRAELTQCDTLYGRVQWVAPKDALRAVGVSEMEETLKERYGPDEGAAVLADLTRLTATKPYVRIDKPTNPAPPLDAFDADKHYKH